MNYKKNFKLFAIVALLFLIITFTVLIFRTRNLEHYAHRYLPQGIYFISTQYDGKTYFLTEYMNTNEPFEEPHILKFVEESQDGNDNKTKFYVQSQNQIYSLGPCFEENNNSIVINSHVQNDNPTVDDLDFNVLPFLAYSEELNEVKVYDSQLFEQEIGDENMKKIHVIDYEHDNNFYFKLETTGNYIKEFQEIPEKLSFEETTEENKQLFNFNETNLENDENNANNQNNENNTNNENNAIESNQQLQNDFYILNPNDTNNLLMSINNISDYILENDQVNVGKKFKMLKFFEGSDMTIFRDDNSNTRDLTLGFYFRIFETQVPVAFENFINMKSLNSSFELRGTLDLINNSIIFTYSHKSEANSLQLVLNNAKILNYVIIQIANPSTTESGFPEITFNLNNQLTKFKFSNNESIKVEQIKFQNYEGFLGRVLVYNDFVRKTELCTKYNCTLSCFRPDGTKDYGGDVNLCIKDCNKSCNDVEKCQKICIDCEVEEEEWDLETKLRLCPWLKDIKKLDKSPPDAPKVRGFAGDGKILIEWKKPFNGRGIISNYIIMVYETFNKKNGIQVNISSNPKCEICEHEIKNLKNQVFYDIIVKAVNNVGIGKSSNIVTLAPNGEKLKNEMNNIFYELDNDLEKGISENDVDVACNNITFDNLQQHALDEPIFEFDEYIKSNRN